MRNLALGLRSARWFSSLSPASPPIQATRDFLRGRALAVLSEPDCSNKVALTVDAARLLIAPPLSADDPRFRAGCGDSRAAAVLPSEPALPSFLEMSDAHTPRHQQLGVPLSVSILHSLAHIEMMALNMYWDTIGRFSQLPFLPLDFYMDFLRVASDEARHWTMLQGRLAQLGSHYGALPVHRMLWDIAKITSEDVGARLALVPLVQEARGLDAGPRLVEKLTSVGDSQSADIVDAIVQEERQHVSQGIKWFEYLSRHLGAEPRAHFQSLIKTHLPQGLSPPFNHQARAACGMDASWYEPLVSTKRDLAAPAAPPLQGLVRAVDDRPTVLFICYVWPEHTSSAAGLRTRSLIEILASNGHRVVCASAAKTTKFASTLTSEFGVSTTQIRLNDSGFDELLTQLSPAIVVFDTFVVEEQFGSRVRAVAPQALRVIDSQDLHFLRQLRRDHVVAGSPAAIADPLALAIPGCPDIPVGYEPMLRELAAIHRSDLTLVCSSFEHSLLLDTFGIPPRKLGYAPFYYKDAAQRPLAGLRGFQHRAHFVTIGNWHHEPNVDSVELLKRVIWPRIHQLLPNAQLHIFGAYPRRSHSEMHDPASKFLVKGTCKDQYATLERYRVLLAPLRFGAGIKGKISDAFYMGTPVVTTPIGSEGMQGASSDSWGGFSCQSSAEFVDAAVRMYNQEDLWNQRSSSGLSIINERFSFEKNASILLETLQRHRHALQSHRAANYVGEILWDASHRATGYRTQLIELRSKS